MKPRTTLQKSSIVFLQAIVMLFGLVSFVFLLWEPHLEGRNENATLFQIYFNDPFLVCAYLGSIAFFVVLYSVFRLLGYIAQREIFTSHSINALKRIRVSSIILACFAIGFEFYIFTVSRRIEEDIAGGVMMGLVLIFSSVITAAVANMFQKVLQRAVDIKTESDLTI